jgi:hypothetical protein
MLLFHLGRWLYFTFRIGKLVLHGRLVLLSALKDLQILRSISQRAKFILFGILGLFKDNNSTSSRCVLIRW